MNKNISLKILLNLTYIEILISLCILCYYGLKPDVELGIFIIGFIFISTILYYIILIRVISYFLRKSSVVHFTWIIVLIILNIFPIIIHLWLLNLI